MAEILKCGYSASGKLLSGTFPWYCLNMMYNVVLTSASVGEILKSDHSNESY